MAIQRLGPKKTDMLQQRLGIEIASAWTRGGRDHPTRIYLSDGRVADYHPKSRALEYWP